MVDGLHSLPNSEYRFFFKSIFSIMASTIKSVSFNADLSVVNVILFINVSASEDVNLSFDTNLSTELWIRSLPLSKNVESVSYAIIDEWILFLVAAIAAVWAIPCPINPRPITPNLSNDELMGVVDENCRRIPLPMAAVALRLDDAVAARVNVDDIMVVSMQSLLWLWLLVNCPLFIDCQ